MPVSPSGAQGTGLQQPPVALLNTANAITTKYLIPILGDQVLVPSPTLWAMTRNGKKFSGGELVYALLTMEEMTGGAYWGNQLLDTTIVDSVQPANQLWKFYRQSIAIPITDVVLNRGGAGALDLIRSKYQIATGSFMMKLSRALWHTAPQNTSLDVDDIDSWVGQTTNTIAGISRALAANSWWLPAAPVSANNVALTANIAEQAYQSVVYGYDEPDLLVMDNTRFANFKNNFTQLIRFVDLEQDETALQTGFRYHFMYNNAIVMADRFTPANTAYLLNTKYIFPTFHELDYFSVEPFIKPTNQRTIVSTMYLTWNVVNLSPRMSVKLTNLT
jgi:hypothetical protein